MYVKSHLILISTINLSRDNYKTTELWDGYDIIYGDPLTVEQGKRDKREIEIDLEGLGECYIQEEKDKLKSMGMIFVPDK